MTRLFNIFCLVSVLCVGSTMGQTSADDSIVTLSLVPDQIKVGTFYRGARIHVSANVPICDGAVIVLEAGNEKVTLNRKGRVAGIWLNVAQVEVSNVPNVYILAASDKLENICSPFVHKQLGLGFDYLRGQMKFTCEKPLSGTEFKEFLKLKTSGGTYNLDININLEDDGPGRQEVSAVLPVPATVPPGTYNVLLYCFVDGKPVHRGTAELSIERVGLAHLMADMAYNKSALYGVMAIVVAMLVGIGMGVVFNSRPGSGH
jgi:uncharacterized protein (TIGR02186 family)